MEVGDVEVQAPWSFFVHSEAAPARSQRMISVRWTVTVPSSNSAGLIKASSYRHMHLAS